MGSWKPGKKKRKKDKRSPGPYNPPEIRVERAGEFVMRKRTDRPRYFTNVDVTVRVGGKDYKVVRSVEITGPVRDYIEGRGNDGPITEEELAEQFKGTVKPVVK